ncbi:glycerophosphodiester phosphodiesterase family protein [Sphingomonas sp. LM7]|uniref:glycerophosphodiester phosphodiesterase family protein n=1 Tax=Sphingomonas sp. LM7 TaxID=1938607 RepID=UPI0009839366|nr:glycerophosphodiester phosphodiesterase family protein [Sphingomonas sp. LM7]AQR72470.1 glycerophosphodiester phosphodiesterase [Sphingomonas sp. LM7]
MRRRWLAAGGAAALLAGIYLVNASWLAPRPTGIPGVLAHRGVHQTFNHVGLRQNDCTASRIDPPTNPYLENTLPSMAASFAAGATALELDVHPTTDGEFAVFHDWTLECRTDGRGVTRDQSMAYLKTLDVGHGYTADRGRSFPFRGKGVGLMPTLHQVLTAFAGRQFLINIKSNDALEADRLVAYLKAHGHPTDHRLQVYAAERPIQRLQQLAPYALLLSGKRGKACAMRYLLIGWSGHVPRACRGSVIGVPINLRWAYWGWPNRFLARMKAADVSVMLTGPIGEHGSGATGLERPDQLDAVPAGFSGMILTDDIEVIGPEVRRRWPSR